MHRNTSSWVWLWWLFSTSQACINALWVCRTALGVPVVPEVKYRAASSSGVSSTSGGVSPSASRMNWLKEQAQSGQSFSGPVYSHNFTNWDNSCLISSIRFTNSGPKIKTLASAVTVHKRILSDSNLKFKGTIQAPVYNTPK